MDSIKKYIFMELETSRCKLYIYNNSIGNNIPEYFSKLLSHNSSLNDTYKLYPGFKSSYNYIKSEQLCRNPRPGGHLVSTKLQNFSVLNVSHWEEYMFLKNWLECPQIYYIEKDEINKIYTEYMEIFENS